MYGVALWIGIRCDESNGLYLCIRLQTDPENDANLKELIQQRVAAAAAGEDSESVVSASSSGQKRKVEEMSVDVPEADDLYGVSKQLSDVKVCGEPESAPVTSSAAPKPAPASKPVSASKPAPAPKSSPTTASTDPSVTECYKRASVALYILYNKLLGDDGLLVDLLNEAYDHLALTEEEEKDLRGAIKSKILDAQAALDNVEDKVDFASATCEVISEPIWKRIAEDAKKYLQQKDLPEDMANLKEKADLEVTSAKSKYLDNEAGEAEL